MSSHSRPFHSYVNTLWDIICAVSLIGIWPRFIEPRRLTISRYKIPIPGLPKELAGLKILQMSDLHLHEQLPPDAFLKKVTQNIAALRPDLILFTGDFLCFSELSERERLLAFLNSCSAPYGCYAILGNHDYQEPVSINERGDYDVIEERPSAILKGLKRLFVDLVPTGKVTESAKAVPLHAELIDLLKKSHFQLLHNETVCVPIRESSLNLCGVGEYMLGRCEPKIAFQHYQKEYPGIILAHNPDSLALLKEYPGSLILSGHTHGGQINLPWIWKKYTLMENQAYAKGGLYRSGNKWMTVSRGLGSVLPFRIFSPPELVLLTLEEAS